jgi:regulator of chromosome condensation
VGGSSSPRECDANILFSDVKVTFVSAASDTTLAVSPDGQAYSWGFSSTYQTGLGTDDDVEEPTLIDNSAVKGKKITWAGVGGQFAMMTAIHEAAESNGVNGH